MKGISQRNPDYDCDEDGEMIVRFGRFMRNMCYEEAPFLPNGDECMATSRKACAWQAPQLPLQVVMLGGQRDREALLPRLDSESKDHLCILANNNKGHIAQIVFQISFPEGIL